jgi:hypothetical protein
VGVKDGPLEGVEIIARLLYDGKQLNKAAAPELFQESTTPNLLSRRRSKAAVMIGGNVAKNPRAD